MQEYYVRFGYPKHSSNAKTARNSSVLATAFFPNILERKLKWRKLAHQELPKFFLFVLNRTNKIMISLSYKLQSIVENDPMKRLFKFYLR